MIHNVQTALSPPSYRSGIVRIAPCTALYIYTCLFRTGLASLYKETDPIPLPYKLKPTPPTEWALDPACIIMP